MDTIPNGGQHSTVASKDIARAFVAVAVLGLRQDRVKPRHDKWIPVTYWSRKINRVLRTNTINSSKLLKAIRSHCQGLDRTFTAGDEDYHPIVIIKSIHRRVAVDCKGTRRREDFLQAVVLKEEKLPEKDEEKTTFFKERFKDYLARKSILPPPPTIATCVGAPAPRTVTPTAFEEAFEETRSLATRVQEEATMAHEPTSQRTEATRESQPTMIESQRTGPFGTLRDFLSKFINEQYVDKEDFFVSTPEEATMAIKAFAADKVNKHHEIFDNGHGSDNDLATKVLDPSMYLPCFDKYALPFRKSVVNDLIHCFVKLADEVPDVLHLMKQSGSKGLGRRLVAVIPCIDNSPANFNQNAKQWMPSLLAALGVDEDNKYFPCFHLINLLRCESTEAFEDVCRTNSTMAADFKMDPLRQIAMFSECNLSYTQGRVMRKYFIADKCNPLLSEWAIRRSEVSPDIMPACSTFQEHKMKRNAWFIPVDKQVIAMLKGRNDLSGVSELHAVLSADHGQGAFRINVTVLLIASGKIVFEKHMLVGHIECKHDTAKVLVDSGVIQGINDSLGRLKGCSNKKLLTGRLQQARVFQQCLGCVPGSIPFPVKLLAVGDLAWFSLALGKDKMSGHHCYRCKAMGTAFKHDPSKRGETWTLTGMREHFARFENGELNRPQQQCGLTVAQQQLGLKQPMLINCIEPADYLSPVLHAVTLLVNTPFDFLKRYIWYRMDDVPLNLIMAREDILRTEIAAQDTWVAKLEADKELNDLKIKLKELKPARQNRFDNDHHQAEYAHLASDQKALEDEVKLRKVAHEAAAKEVAKAKRALRSMEDNHKEYGKVTRDLWMSIERMLKAEFNVYASTYHGGDMEGNQCRNLVRNAPKIMMEVKDILLKHRDSLGPEEKSRRASCQEIEVYCRGFERLFQYMDLISHYCYQPYGSMTDADVQDAKRAIDLGTSMWHRLMPTIPMKVHVWHHLKDDLEKYRGLASHHEQHIERAHQVGKKNERRLGAVKDFQKKTIVILKHNCTTESAGVRAQAADAEKQSKARGRKRKRVKIDVDEAKAERTNYLKSILQLPELTDCFHTLRELQLVTYHQRRQRAEPEAGAI
jgi:hypothetical protein